MSDTTSGRGIASDDFDDDEIEWDDEAETGEGDTDGLSPIEQFASDAEDFVGGTEGDEDDVDDDDPDNDGNSADS